MKNLYSEDISKYTETKGCPSKSSMPYLDTNTNSINMNKWREDDPDSYNDLSANLTPCNSLFFNDSESQGCCYSTNNYNEDNSVGLKIDFSGVKYNVYNKYDVQNIFKNNVLDDPNSTTKFFKLVFLSLFTILSIGILGSCYEFFFRYGNNLECLKYVNDCKRFIDKDDKNDKTDLTVFEQLLPDCLTYYPYQNCSITKDYADKTIGGFKNQNGGGIMLENKIKTFNCKYTFKENSYTSKTLRNFPYNLSEFLDNYLGKDEGNLFKMPFKVFANFFTINMVLNRKCIKFVLDKISNAFKKVDQNNPIINNLIFLIISGILFVIIGFYSGTNQLSSATSWLPALISFIISIVSVVALILSFISMFVPEFAFNFLINNNKDNSKINRLNITINSDSEGKPNSKFSEFMDQYIIFKNFLKKLPKKEDTTKKVNYWLKLFGTLFLNFFVIPPLVVIVFMLSFIIGTFGNILSMIYLNFEIIIKLFIIPFSVKEAFFTIVKSHADLLTLLFCAIVVASAGEAFDKVTTGIMGGILGILIIFKILYGLKNIF